ncbi:hypothetical protein ABE276_002379 [Salmonella enterica]
METTHRPGQRNSNHIRNWLRAVRITGEGLVCMALVMMVTGTVGFVGLLLWLFFFI